MRIKFIPVCVLLSLFGLGSSFAQAQEAAVWYVPHHEEFRTPIEDALQSPELALPGFGIQATREQLMKRFQHALNNKWLDADQVDRFCNELKTISDKEQGRRDEEGKLNFKGGVSVAKQLHDLNKSFEETVLAREQNNPGLEGLQARKAVMLQRVSYGVSKGKFTGRRAAYWRSAIRQATAELPESDLDPETEKDVALELQKISRSMEKEISGPSIAERPSPFTR